MIISFREIIVEDAEKLLKWRSSERVSHWMRTTIHNDMHKQQEWIITMREKPDSYHWIAQINGEDAAYVKFNDFNPESQTAEEGCYIGLDNYVYLHCYVLKSFYESLFMRLNLKFLISNVISGNKIVNILKYLGNEIDYDRVDMPKNDEREWIPYKLCREKFLKKFAPNYVSHLPTELWKYNGCI